MVVLTSFSTQQIIRKPEASRRLVKWAIELGPFHIEFKPCTAYKDQILADFLVEGPVDGTSVSYDEVA